MLEIMNSPGRNGYASHSGQRQGPQGLILAAGRGRRLGSKVDEIPKCLLQVDGRTLLDHQLSMLKSAGITDVCVVVGYKQSVVTRACHHRAQIINNPRWAETNSLYSFSLARQWVNRSVVVMNCDVLAGHSVLTRLLESKSSSFAFDSGSGGDDEHMKVELSNGSLKSMSKSLDASLVHGENVGMLHFSADDAKNLFKHAESILGQGGEKMWMASAVQELSRERELQGVDIKGSAWIEIDYQEDLEAARNRIWPMIERKKPARDMFRSVVQPTTNIPCYDSF